MQLINPLVVSFNNVVSFIIIITAFTCTASWVIWSFHPHRFIIFTHASWRTIEHQGIHEETLRKFLANQIGHSRDRMSG